MAVSTISAFFSSTASCSGIFSAIAEKIPEQEAVEEKKAEIVETAKAEPKTEPPVVETEQPPAQNKLEAPQTVVESQKPAEVKKVEAPKDVPAGTSLGASTFFTSAGF